MQRTKSKLLSILLSLVMLLSLLPTTTLAAAPDADVALYNNAGKLISLSNKQYLATNGDTEASTGYNGTQGYVARYEASTGTLFLKDYHGVGKDGGIMTVGDLNIVVESDSSFTTSITSSTNTLMGIQSGKGKLDISGDGTLTVSANGNSDVYGIFAKEGVTISAPLDVTVKLNDSTTKRPLYGIYTNSGAISLSGSDMTVTVTGGGSAVYGVYNNTFTPEITDNGNIDISGKLTVNLINGSSNVGIHTGSGSKITLDNARVNIPGNFYFGIYNNNGDVVIQNKSNVTLTSAIESGEGIYAKYGGDLSIENSTVSISAKGYAADLEKGKLSIKDSIVDLTLGTETYCVVNTYYNAANKIDLSGSDSGSVTLTALGKQTNSMIGGTVTATPGTKCVKGTYYDYQNYDGEYDKANNITVLQFVHESTTPTTNISVSGTIKSYGSASDAVTVTLTPTAGGTTLTTTPTGAASTAPYSQNYTFAAVPAGTYTLKVEKKGHAPWTENITVGTDDITGKDVTIYLIGDVNGDGAIDATDMQRIYAHISRDNPFSNPAQGDVNGDRNVDATDMQRIYAHISRENPLS